MLVSTVFQLPWLSPEPVIQSPRESYCEYSTTSLKISKSLQYMEQKFLKKLLKEISCSVLWKSPDQSKQTPRMPKATKSSAHRATPEPPKEMCTSSQDEQSSSEQEPDPKITFHHPRQPQPVPSMFVPYIEGPKMDWTLNDGLYHRFLKWCLKCKNILECMLAALTECQQCKKVIVRWLWHGPICVLGLANRPVNTRYNSGKIWVL